MNIEQFSTQMNRLRKVYGESTYPDELLTILWDSFGGMSEMNFLRVVSECIATRPRSKPPLRDDLKEIAAKVGALEPKVNYYAMPVSVHEDRPWPAPIMGLMLVMKRNLREGIEKGYAFGLAACRLTDDEAFTLFYAYQNSDWEHAAAQKIIERRGGEAAIKNLKAFMAKQKRFGESA